MIALLRAVNVGGKSKIKMEDLRAICHGLGFQDVHTYVQSGNVVFRTTQRNQAKLAAQIEDAIEAKLAFRPKVVVRTAAEMQDVIARNPFAGRTDIDESKLLITFLVDHPPATASDDISKVKTQGEEIRLSGRELFIYFPNGAGRSKISASALDKALRTTGTARNLRTVAKLVEMASNRHLD